MITGIFAGSFDPIHIGHINILKRSRNFCDKIIIGIGNNSAKKSLFSLQEKISFIENSNFYNLDLIDDGHEQVFSIELMMDYWLILQDKRKLTLL